MKKIKWDEDIAPVLCGYLLVALMIVTPLGAMLSIHDYREKQRDKLMLKAGFKVNPQPTPREIKGGWNV